MKSFETFVSRLEVGSPQHFKQLTVFPLFAPVAHDADYLLLDEALTTARAKVTEVSEGGTVPELWFENAADRAVLLLDGDQLAGAKQNRVLNLSILVGSGRSLKIPVSCVEQGRWSYRSREFHSTGRTLFAKARANKMRQVSKSLARDSSRRSDQAEVWRDVSDKLAAMEVASSSMAMDDAYSAHSTSLDAYSAAFPAVPHQVGAIFAIGARTVGLDVFDVPSTFARQFPKVVSSYAMDALEAERANPQAVAAAREEAQRFLSKLAQASAKQYPAVGEGEDLRLEAPGLAGAALTVGDRVVHLAAFVVQDPVAAGAEA